MTGQDLVVTVYDDGGPHGPTARVLLTPAGRAITTSDPRHLRAMADTLTAGADRMEAITAAHDAGEQLALEVEA